MEYADSVDMEIKKKIWDLYFYKGYTYEELETHFKGKYKYSQLKSIIMARYDYGNSK